MGAKTTKEALTLSQEAGLDLVLVSPTTNPPVAKIMDYGKYRYEQQKLEQKHKKMQKVAEIKEIRLSLKIDKHDLETKLDQAKGFFEKNHKVKLVIVFRGREVTFLDQGKSMLQNIIKGLEPIAEPEERVSYLARKLSVVMVPKNKK